MSEINFEFKTSRSFNDWLLNVGGSIAFTTYQAGKIYFLGLQSDGRLSFFDRSFPRSMGLAVSQNSNKLFLSTEYQIYEFDNLIADSSQQGDFDAVYAPHKSWITGDLDIHGIKLDADDNPIFVNTQFNCLASLSDGYSFKPFWKPQFIDRLLPEDRCHLNGLAMKDGSPRYVSCISKSNVADGWRDKRKDGGIIIDITNNEIIAENLSMPHSPEFYQGKLWILNSGTGELGHIDTENGLFTPIAFCPGYARGLAFVKNFAIVGLSLPRDNKTFQGLDLDDALASQDSDPRCGLLIIDIETGNVVHWVRIEGVVKELFDTVFIPGVKCPSAIGLKTQEILRVISIDEEDD